MQEILSKKLLGERIRSLRLEKDYAQSHVANFLNLSRSNYSQIELGNQYPTFNTLSILSQHYNKTYEWLLHGTETEVIRPRRVKHTVIVKDLEKTLRHFSASLKKLEHELEQIKTKMA
jgi:transcriptional regulator with XRE-family HTH domain